MLVVSQLRKSSDTCIFSSDTPQFVVGLLFITHAIPDDYRFYPTAATAAVVIIIHRHTSKLTKKSKYFFYTVFVVAFNEKPSAEIPVKQPSIQRNINKISTDAMQASSPEYRCWQWSNSIHLVRYCFPFFLRTLNTEQHHSTSTAVCVCVWWSRPMRSWIMR